MRTDLSIKSETQTGQDVAGPIPLAYAVTRQAGEAGAGDSRIVAVGNSTFVDNENLDNDANRDFFLSAVSWLLGGRGEETISPRVIGAEKLIVPGGGLHQADGGEPGCAAADRLRRRGADLVAAEEPVRTGLRLGLLGLVAVAAGRSLLPPVSGHGSGRDGLPLYVSKRRPPAGDAGHQPEGNRPAGTTKTATGISPSRATTGPTSRRPGSWRSSCWRCPSTVSCAERRRNTGWRIRRPPSR